MNSYIDIKRFNSTLSDCSGDIGGRKPNTGPSRVGHTISVGIAGLITAALIIFVAYGVATDCPNTHGYVYCAPD